MPEANIDSLYDHPSGTFLGVRFVLLGFDAPNEQKVRTKLVNGGGVDVGQYSQDCTHVIVDKLVYDDSVCVAARRDGKSLVTGLWVDHSFDIGMPVDANSIMYRPLKDLNGIPGAKSLVVCLTGYQRQDRDDIMTMVGLMGAQFSKPLVANKVTHLICYKFEGEKYELAKKMKKIKLVNHRWLEDCLRAWEILSESNYNKSGYEMEAMEAEAKDSEEEAEDSVAKQFTGRNVNASPPNLQAEMSRAPELPLTVGKVSKMLPDITAAKGSPNIRSGGNILLTARNEGTSNQALPLHNVNQKHPEVLGFQENVAALGNAVCGEKSEIYERTPLSNAIGNDLASTSRSAERSLHSGTAKLGSRSYSRKGPVKSTLQTYAGELLSNANHSSKEYLDEYKVREDQNNFGCVQSLSKQTDLSHKEELSSVLPQKRKTDVSCPSSKSPKMCQDSKPGIMGSPLVGDRMQGSETASLVNGLLGANNHISDDNAGHPMDTSTTNSALKSPAKISTMKCSGLGDSLLANYPPNSKAMASDIAQDGNAEAKAPQTYSGRLERLMSVGNTRNQQNQQQGVEVSSPNVKEPMIEKSQDCTNLDVLEGDNINSIPKSSKSKIVAKKSLGSRSKLSTSNSATKKGSIYSRRATSQNDSAVSLNGGKKTAGCEKSCASVKFQMVPSTVNVKKVIPMEAKTIQAEGIDMEAKIDSMDEETEAPEDKDEYEFEKAVNEKSETVELTHNADIVMEENLEGMHISNKAKANSTATCLDTVASKVGKNQMEPESAGVGKKADDQSTMKADNALKGKISKGKKRPLGKMAVKNVPSVTGIMESKEKADGEGIDRNEEKAEPGGTLDNPVLVNKVDNSVEVEKENKPIVEGQNRSQGKQHVGKMAVSKKKTMKTDQNADKVDIDSGHVGVVANRVKMEPVWFILSGHKLQRKEFQQVIRRLKGRICRDSHHWSYQATHFIVPDPIRRTEKFFAAAASGRWILKTDYLTASSQEGKFLPEEPYEWYKNGLSEDGAINLEAPRKWRHVREKTGHGAFYGLRIIIYGECIAPPLDTLKRVVKAGDGIILATSPPYSRFLNSGVDFALVSPTMPRVDLWVQEFLRHEIPCVVADYLVEYVCKPGYSLERHVLYNTNAWAEKSFARMLSRSEEIVEDPTPPDDSGSNDLTCEVCGSCERGDVMLICGDESGSVGCGVGTHIDCCDPPLEAVPDEDWFCPKCIKSRNSKSSPKAKAKAKASKKGNSSRKSK
ncbi:BRCT domain-containing protein At4g02110 [Malania oleifera]|uniref:BRCT domain-containing protein At4g02110 n=1 Tax=Malania oleifera TaxID=397392 RepID=UPI0025ADBE79|nr:BRCT domain-containing protein At4g02110 [Malania oleifera]